MEENIDGQKEWLDEQYVEMALEKYEKIKSVVSNGRRPTRYEKELISLIFNKMVDPYYYWAEARIKLKRYLDKGFEELNARMKKIGYSYERGSRSFVK